MDVAAVYVEEGASAKTFERPQWKRLLARIETGRTPDVDLVLVVKWDRFSRDATGALGMIRRLDARGVAVQAAEQPIDTSVPEQLLMQVLYVAAPEVENRRRSLATKAGMRRAMLEGRYVNVPPKGYARGRDERDRFLIVPGPDAEHVRTAFRLAADTNRSMESIRLELRKAGFRCSKNQFGLMLRKPIYAGRIVIPAWGGEPERDVAGVHEPLTDAGTFARVQAVRFGVVDCRSKARRRLIPELPLRGHLLCPEPHPEAGARLKGSRSKSRHGYVVWYYHTTGKGAYRVQASRAHTAFADYLRGIQLAPPVADLLRSMAEERSTAGDADRRRRAQAAERALVAADDALLKVDLRHMDGDLDRDSRDRLLAHYRAARDEARATIADAVALPDDPVHLTRAVDVLERLPDVWAAASPEARDVLAGSMWPSGLTFDGARFRTPDAAGIIGLLTQIRGKSKDARRSKEAGVLCSAPGRI